MLEIVDRVRSALRRAAIAGVLFAIALLLAFVAAGFGIAALHELLKSDLSDEAAAVIVAGILLVLAGIMGLIGMTLMKGPKKRKPGSRNKAQSDPAALLMSSMGGKPWMPLAIAVAAGFAFGISPEIRREAARFLRHEAERKTRG